MSTHGSQLVRLQHPHLMQAGASARERIKEAAAQAWGVERSAISAKQGVLKAGNRTGTYAEFATAAAKITLDSEPAIKKPGEWWLLGRPTQRLDIPVKVNGSAQYAIDTRVPGMVYAAVKASPVPWGALKRYDFDGDQEPAGRHRRGRAEGRSRQARSAGLAERGRGRRRHLVSREDGARSDADRMGFRRVRGCEHGEPLCGGAQADGREGSSQQGRSASARNHRQVEEGRDGGVRAAVRNARPHGADQRDRACAGGPRRRVVADAGPVGRNPARCRPAWRRPEECLRAHDVLGRRLWRQRRRRHRRDAASSRDLEAGRKAGEGAVVARRGYRAGQAAAAWRLRG